MRKEFPTIEIVNLICSYVGIMGVCLGIHLLFGYSVHFLFFILLPLPLYRIFSGKISVEITEEEWIVTWVKKPQWHSFENKRIPLSEIIRWKYEKGYRSPDQFILILESGEKTRIRLSMFSLRDMESELWGELNKRMDDFHSETSEGLLQQKILDSGYISGLDVKLRNYQVIRVTLVVSSLMVLLIGSFNSDAHLVWILFLSLLCTLLLVNFRYIYLKNERSRTLHWLA